MTCSVPGLVLNPGGDFAQTVDLMDENGAVVDASGMTASIVDPTGEVGGALAASVVGSRVRLTATWQGVWSTTPRVLGTARLSLVQGADEHVSRPFPVSVPGSALRLVVARGSDMSWRFTWPDDRDGASLMGEVVDIINASAVIAPLATIVVINAATNECELRIEGDLSVALGEGGTLQVRRRTGATNPRTLAPLSVSFR
jgi:hypothetical protein